MKELMTNEVLTMSTLDIAELVHSRHDSVKISVQRLARRGVIGLPSLMATYNQQNKAIRNKDL